MTDDQQPRWPKILTWCLLLAALAGGVWFAKPAYRNWKKHRYLEQAAQFLDQSDFKNAALSARQVLALSPMDLQATRIMAEITSQLRSPEMLAWRQRVVDIEPDDPGNAVALAEAALLFGDVRRAELALTRIPVTNRNTLEFHKAAAMLLAGQNRLAEAEAHFTSALKLAPTNKLLQLNRAVILLQAQDTNVVAEGMRTLEEFSTDPNHRRMALQNLSQACLRTGQPKRAIRIARELAAGTNANFGDQMLLLSVLRDAGSSEFLGELKSVEALAASAGPEQIQALASWLIASGQGVEAAHWLNSLPDTVKSKQRVSMVRAELFLSRSEWRALEELTASPDWGGADFLRHAYRARACREQQRTVAADSAWLEATRAARGNPKMLSALARLAADWKWAREEEELLWTLVERHPAERWAAEALSRIFFETSNTRGLNRLAGALVAQNPDNLIAKNNLAMTSLLLGQQTARANELALEVFTKFPSNEAAASTYAYSLYLQNRREEALKAFADVTPAALEQPSVAVYYGVILGTNAPSESAHYLDLAVKGNLLPEERALLEAARQSR